MTQYLVRKRCFSLVRNLIDFLLLLELIFSLLFEFTSLCFTSLNTFRKLHLRFLSIQTEQNICSYREVSVSKANSPRNWKSCTTGRKNMPELSHFFLQDSEGKESPHCYEACTVKSGCENEVLKL